MTTRITTTCGTCGWTGTYDTPGRADYAHRQHSCELHRVRLAKAARARARAAAVDRTPATCHHPKAQHEHGTYATYTLDHCRCEPCSNAAAKYERRRTRRNAYGRSDMVDAGPAREHIRQLQAAGMGYKNIARTAGVSTGVLWALIYGKPLPGGRRRAPCERLHQSTASKLLAVRVQLADGAKIDATGSRRRLQALIAIGYSAAHLAAITGLDRQILDALLQGRRGLITSGNAAIITDHYVQLEHTPRDPGTTHGQRSSVERAIRRAARAGWLVPAWWDPDTIDDPEHDPRATEPGEQDVDDAVVQLTLDGARPRRLTTTERHTALRQLHTRGLTDAQAAHALGVTPTTVLRDRQVLGLPAVVDHGRGAAA